MFTWVSECWVSVSLYYRSHAKVPTMNIGKHFTVVSINTTSYCTGLYLSLRIVYHAHMKSIMILSELQLCLFFFSSHLFIYSMKNSKKKLLMNSLNWKFACMNICVTFDIDRALMVWKVVEGDNEKRGKAMQELVTYNPKQWVGLHLCVVSRK